ncbi:MAG: ribonuclease HI [Janthinobacterium sp.]|jgi:ribonuclease HI
MSALPNGAELSITEPAITEDALIAAAYNTERVASRRLARSAGLSPHAALKATLEKIAAAQGWPDLPGLLLARAQAQRATEARLAAKVQQQAANLALKKSRNAPAPQAWLAWFDGSAHPNPGKIGIGGLIIGPAGQRIAISESAGYGNSSEAEYLALIAVLEALVLLQPAQLVIYGDSLVIIDDVNRPMAEGAGAKGLHGLRTRTAALMAQLIHVQLRWIPRQKNAAADRLSQQAVAKHDAGLPA